jgi:hypothetical protein
MGLCTCRTWITGDKDAPRPQPTLHNSALPHADTEGLVAQGEKEAEPSTWVKQR